MGKWKIVETVDATGTESSHEVDTFESAITSVLADLKTPNDRVVRIEGPDGEKFGRWWIERRYDARKEPNQ
jgi:hypothetical protein